MYIIFWYIIGFCSWGFLCKLLRIRWIPEEANFWGKLIQLLKALQVIFKEFSLGMKNKCQETLISVFEIDLKSCNHHSLEHTYTYWDLFILLMNIPSPKLRRFKLEKLKCLLWSVLKSWKQANYCRLLCFFKKKKHFFIVFGVKLTPSNFQSLWKWTSFRNQQVLCIKYIF